ncbi:putative entry exclusion protein TrbK-alt [Bradyrhizobium sp. INPA03-11B]|uniref:putative entry exclusion protein TrbK-alt n=1 Tax=Bradyrhizobium sp. INPA03-11B TaxID=418598 RepID=UPI00338D8477
MTDGRAFKALSVLATISVLIVTACTIQLRGGDDALPAPEAAETTGAASSDLTRCRSVAAEQTAAYQHCRQVWAENRRRFLGKKNDTAAAGRDDSTGTASAPKDQSRILHGYPQPAAPEVSKP